jgi:ribosomal protein S18 acetylase RimI-like enzyme
MMELQPAKPDDREKILRLLHQGTIFTDEEIKVALEVVDDALNGDEKEYQIFCAFDKNKKLTGFICFGPILMTHGCYDLYWIVVDKKAVRKGVGGKLLGFMEEMAAREGGRRIYVETSSSPPYSAARSFYKTHGYRVVSLLNDFYRDGDHKITLMKEIYCAAKEKYQISYTEKGLLCHQ